MIGGRKNFAGQNSFLSASFGKMAGGRSLRFGDRSHATRA